MSIRINYIPPSIDAVAALRAVAEDAVVNAAQVLLDASQSLVPVDTGALKSSGHVVKEDGLSAAVVYGAEDGAGRNGQDTAAYAVPQHERMDFEHPNGQAKFLEIPLHEQSERVAEVIAVALRAVM